MVHDGGASSQFGVVGVVAVVVDAVVVVVVVVVLVVVVAVVFFLRPAYRATRHRPACRCFSGLRKKKNVQRAYKNQNPPNQNHLQRDTY